MNQIKKGHIPPHTENTATYTFSNLSFVEKNKIFQYWKNQKTGSPASGETSVQKKETPPTGGESVFSLLL